ncbi:hypothetical protein MASR2M48_04190 [Spirochaetota bacterium]
MKKFIAILIVALFMGGSVFAQSSASGGKKSSTPTAFQLTISVNPSNAAIYIDGGQIKGNVATVGAGNHTVMTRAKGYVDFSTTVSVSGTMYLPITMSPATFQLSVNANNVKGRTGAYKRQIHGRHALCKPANAWNVYNNHTSTWLPGV